MTPLKLPRPRKGKLPFREAIALDYLATLDRSSDAIADLSREALAAAMRVAPAELDETLFSLQSRGRILLGVRHFAISSRLSAKLKQERDRNRQRQLYGNSRQGSLSADWSLHRRAALIFPALRGPVSRPETYNRPAAFEPLLKQHPHHHKRECPADVEILTEACYPGELSTVLTFIEEQASANRTPVLLYTRKAIYVGVRRAPKR